MKRTAAWILLSIGLSSSAAMAAGLDLEATQRLHRLRAGESLADMAEEFLGGAEYVQELLELNNIRNLTAVREGTWIALPGPVRDEAIRDLQRAEAALQTARDARAEEYAPDTFRRVGEKIDQAKEARVHANYEKSIAHAKVGLVLANQAKREADANARVSRDGRIARVHGRVEISDDGGATWRDASDGMQLPILAILRTDPTARAEVHLQDGSILQITEGSEFRLDQFIEDLRDGNVDVRLDVRIGAMFGKIKPKTGGSKMSIKSGKAAIAVRGTELRARADEEDTAYSEVLAGRVEVVAGRRRPIAVKEGFGVVAKAGRAPSKPIPLLPAPAILEPPAGQSTTAVQRVWMAWRPLKNREVKKYQVEIARDADFHAIEQNLFTRNSRIRSNVLAEGDYYWRVTPIDRHGLVGVPSEPRSLVIRSDLRIEMWFRGKLVEHRRKRVASPSNTYQIRPVSPDTSIVRYEYSLNSDTFQEFTAPLTIPSSGEHVLRMRGVGIDGAVGEEQLLEFLVDATPPDISIDISAPFRTAGGTRAVEASLAAADDTGLDRIEVSVDGGSFTAYEGPFLLSAYKDYEVRFRAIDLLGNASPEFQVRIAGEWVPREEGPSYAPAPK